MSEDQCARFQLPPPALIEGRMSEIAAFLRAIDEAFDTVGQGIEGAVDRVLNAALLCAESTRLIARQLRKVSFR